MDLTFEQMNLIEIDSVIILILNKLTSSVIENVPIQQDDRIC